MMTTLNHVRMKRAACTFCRPQWEPNSGTLLLGTHEVQVCTGFALATFAPCPVLGAAYTFLHKSINHEQPKAENPVPLCTLNPKAASLPTPRGPDFSGLAVSALPKLVQAGAFRARRVPPAETPPNPELQELQLEGSERKAEGQ